MPKSLPSWPSLLKPYRLWIGIGMAVTAVAGVAGWVLRKVTRKGSAPDCDECAGATDAEGT